MSNNPPTAISATKAGGNSVPQLSPLQSQPTSSSTGDGVGQRRSGGTGSFGAGASSRLSPSPRNAQATRKQHKTSKRSRLVDDDAIVQSAAMRSTNSRKGQTSITHLMNFSLPPRPQSHHSYGSHPHVRRTTRWGLGSGYHAVDKARYIHANYRFIVDPRGDYHTQSMDADVHLDWNNVLQVLASAQSQAASCPICLGVPVAPRMAKCGHIFCLPCLLRYMHSEDGTPAAEKRARWKKCPICEDSIYVNETRPVRWYYGQEAGHLQEGSDVVLRLVTRATGSTLALPRDGADALGKDEDVPWYVAAEVMDYARIIKGSESYISSQYDSDIQELEKQEKEDEVMFGEDNVEWMRKAIRMLRESKEKHEGIGNPPNLAKPAEPKSRKPPIVYHQSEGPEMYHLQTSETRGQTSAEQTAATEAKSIISTDASPDSDSTPTGPKALNIHPSAKPSNISRLHQQHSSNQTPSEYFFYHALLHYYLSPLDIRILKSAFGSFSSFPSTILPRIEHISTGHVVDDELRKRTKYLAHIPYGCEVAFLECDWTDTVSPEVLEKFKPEIERRRKKNQEKVNREEKSRIKAERDETDRYRRTKRPSFSNNQFSVDDFAPLVSASPGGTILSDDAEAHMDSASTSPPWPNRRNQGQGSSFASLASPSTSPSTSRTVWGTAAIAPKSPVLYSRAEGEHDDGWLQDWERDLLDNDDLTAQVQALSMAGDGASQRTGNGGMGKKGKKKKITLMSTNVRRGA
ncbi:hypothetical protein EJ05DRAFT_476641 [Pseudovirgaria hyperparasitica]|uniref:RING-type domain-containing protein n=1 Tax=Pseudovirgaria hyperparasitica TaxID=470096 RepID=A0A6A6W8G5_9PEZI|nr:uncharacterized protein EJ05DRAFT_476641 [Pseudovirgaria hyperparasitica]KAF2757371.1 hypothetical protein EJ05DRAFT_476641 [Pseudovirgaria hyperparasitica]